MTYPAKAWALSILLLALRLTQSTAELNNINGGCPAGYAGNGCAICQTDAACTASTGNSEATCSANLTFAPNSQTKAWSCDLSGGFLETIIKPGSLLLVCNTGLEAGQTLGPAPATTPAPAPAPAEEALAPAAEGSTSNGRLLEQQQQQPQPDNSGMMSMLADVLGRLFNGGGAGGASSAAPPAGPSPSGSIGRRRRRLQQASSSSSSSPQGAHCTLSFTVSSGDVKVQCNTTQCAMSPGSGSVSCAQSSCTCPEDATCGGGLVATLVGTVSGKASLDCQDSGDCAVKLTGLPVSQLDTKCSAGECLVPLNATLNSTAVNETSADDIGNLHINPIIAAIPTMILCLVLALLGAYSLANPVRMAGVALTPAQVAKLQAAAAKPVAQAGAPPRVAVLEFRDITVSVPLSAKAAAKRRAALHSKAVRSAAAAAGQPPALGSAILHSASHLVHSAAAHLHLTAGGDEGSDPERQREYEEEGAVAQAGEQLGRSGTPDDLKQQGSDIAGSSSDASGPTSALHTAADYVCSLHQSPSQPNRWFILKGVTGSVPGGQVVGVLGPSGCGKTSLLGSIAGSAMDLGSAATLTGSVTVDGHSRRRRQVAYVPQSDLLIPSLTVQESLRYSALLRLPADTSPSDIQIRVDNVLAELGLRHVADSQVGGSGRIRGVSGGERRRVTIGMELVTDPDIIVLDEPTSGLDSYTADSLLASLHQVAAGGRVVIASLHQPSRDIFFALDQVLLMGHGRLLYTGPPSEADAWLSARGLPCPPRTQLAEHLLKVASSAPDIRQLLCHQDEASDGSGGSEGTGVGVKGGAPALPLPLSSSPLATGSPSPQSTQSAEASPTATAAAAEDDKGSDAAAGALLGGEDEQEQVAEAKQSQRRPPGIARQLSVLFWRSWVDIVRSPTLLRLHCLVAVAMGVLTGAVFWQMDYTNIGIQNRMGGTFFALAFLAFTSLTTVDLLLAERQVVSKEVRGGYYQPASYLLSKLTLDAVLLRALPAVLYWLPFYYMSGFRTASTYAATFAFTLIAFSCAMGALSMAVTVVSDTAGAASFTMNCILLLSLVFTGFLVNISAMPAFLRWVHYLSLFFYAWEGLVTSECSTLVIALSAGPYSVPNLSGSIVIETLGLNPGATTRDIAVLVGLWFGLSLMAMALFLLRLPRQPGSSPGGRWWQRLRRLQPMQGKKQQQQQVELAPPSQTPSGKQV